MDGVFSFFELLYGDQSGVVEFRALNHGCEKHYLSYPVSDDDQQVTLEKLQGWHHTRQTFFGVALRKDASSGKATNCQMTDLLWSDLDLADFPELCGGKNKAELQQMNVDELSEYKSTLIAQTLNLCADHHIPPLAIVDSGHGLQIYWKRDLVVDHHNTEKYNRSLALLLGGDSAVCDIAHTLRMIDTQNLKNPARPLPVEWIYRDEDARISEEVLSQLPLSQKDKPKILKPGFLPSFSSVMLQNHDLILGKYVAKILEGEVQGVLDSTPGNRNVTLNKSAFALGRLVGAGVLDEGIAMSNLESAALSVGLEAAEIHSTLTSALKVGRDNPRDLSAVGKVRSKPQMVERIEKRIPLPESSEETPDSEDFSMDFPTELTMPALPMGTLPTTDAANAEILCANQMDQTLRYTPGLGWFVYHSRQGRWVSDPELLDACRVAGGVLRRVLGCELGRAIERRETVEHIKTLTRWGIAVGCVPIVNRALQAVSGTARFLTKTDEWDKDAHLVNCKNGILNLKDGTFFSHDPQYLMTWQMNAEYNPQATHPYVDQLLDLLKADGRHDFLQRLFGSALYGEAPNESITVLYGEGGTGKGTLIDAMVAMLGDYAGTVDISLLLHNSRSENVGPKPELLMLRGKRLVVAGEPPQGARFNAGRVKGMSGNDPITARNMHSPSMVTFNPIFKLIIHSNYDVGAGYDDTGLQRRIKVVPFTAKPEQPNPDFKRILKTDPLARSALLNWALQGCKDWLESGYDLAEPEIVKEATSGYWQKQNPYEVFCNENLRFGHNETITSTLLKSLFAEWTEENAAQYLTKLVDLYSYLKLRGAEPRRTNKGRFWLGVTVLPPEDENL